MPVSLKSFCRKANFEGQGQEFGSFFFLNVYLFLRERDRARVGEGQTERETQLQAPGSRLRAVCTGPDVGPELTDREIMTCAEVGHLTD